MGASFYYMGRTLYGGIRDLASGEVAVRWGSLAGALGIAAGCGVLGGWLWQLALASLGLRLGFRECLSIQATSNLAKYLPGYAWQQVGKGYLTQRAVHAGGRVGLALLVEFGALVGTAGVLAFAAMPAGTVWPWVGAPPTGVRVLAGGGLALVLVLGAPLGRLALRRVARARPAWVVASLRPAPFYGLLGAALLSWLLFGVSYALTVGALHPLPLADWPLALHTLTLSFVVSLLTPFVPGGIGVREGLMAYLLAARLPGGAAALAAVLSRLVVIAGELSSLGISRAWEAIHRR
jgi:hypothetical protein